MDKPEAGDLDPRLLEILACPACDERPPVELVEGGLVCSSCGRVYPVKDGIPEMLVESATLPETSTIVAPETRPAHPSSV